MKQLVMLALAVSWCAGAEPEPAGRLLNVSGTWKREPGPERVRPGMLVYSGDALWLLSAQGPAVAEFILFDGRTLRCGRNGRCEIPRVVPPPKSLWERLAARRDAPQVAFTIARGETINESVLAYRGGSLDLAPAIRSLDKARYRIVLRNLRESAAPVEFPFEWQPRSPTPANVTITPGLYEMTVITPEEGMLGPSAVLIANAASYAESSQKFDQALASVERAQPPLSDLARRQFALAILDALP